MRPKIIAYYLPQFHPIKENDEWWGKGFTEWTNVGKAKPLYRGHNQPRVPADLGYYDLRVPEVREQQAQLAREAGVYGFCYWHYWFGNGRQLLNEIIDEVGATGKPDFPFCLGWANHSWQHKQWRFDEPDNETLIEQCYGGEADYRAHYEYVRTLITNKNYIRIDGKPFFFIFNPSDIPDIKEFITYWNRWVQQDKIADGFYFVYGTQPKINEIDSILNLGFAAVSSRNGDRLSRTLGSLPFYLRFLNKVKREYFKIPTRISMERVNKFIPELDFDSREDVIPILFPQWDHSPRSMFARAIIESTPSLFKEQARNVLSMVKTKKNQLVMLWSWNEWGECNYMEPDLKWGHGYIDALRKAIDEIYK